MLLNLLPTRARKLFLLFLLTAEVGVVTGLLRNNGELAGTLFLPKRPVVTQWSIIEPQEVDEGATIPADVNVTFHLPLDIDPIRREVLLGNRGTVVRYWGYCFPTEDDPQNPVQTVGFPGRLFLSEAERTVREQAKRLPVYSIYSPPTKEEWERNEILQKQHGLIRHQVEIFTAGQNCYIMSSAPLPIGTDRDQDALNSKLEIQYGTDVDTQDTDGDGLVDGAEVLGMHTDPLNPDSDGDGISDGTEVHGHGAVLLGDTNPLLADSDHDGLCDGYCFVDRNRQYCTPESQQRCTGTDKRQAGEDQNLNGVVDDGETDPLKTDTDDDGILDIQEYYNCLLEGSNDC
ncbi:MAG: hypothetical protein WCV62_04655 [Candidatus Peribacteraceae bacterium]|jgi:hypothetical protein